MTTIDQRQQLLSYVAQKEPSSTIVDDQQTTVTAVATTIVYSTVVHTFLFDANDRQYISQGQVDLRSYHTT